MVSNQNFYIVSGYVEYIIEIYSWVGLDIISCILQNQSFRFTELKKFDYGRQWKAKVRSHIILIPWPELFSILQQMIKTMPLVVVVIMNLICDWVLIQLLMYLIHLFNKTNETLPRKSSL